jgi:4'-phosphopantetheinyl transferase EntD
MTVMPSVFPSLFSIPIAAAEMREAGDLALLYPAEAAHVERAVAKRRGEFAAGRLCARSALAAFGIIDFPVRVADDRQPIWPPNLVGSITHTDGLCAAVVADRSQALGIGIDSEVVEPMSTEMRARICVPDEVDWLASLPVSQLAAAAMLIFSAKEAFYKAQSPLTGEWLDFSEVSLEVSDWPPERTGQSAAAGRFLVRPIRPIALAQRVPLPVAGRYLFHQRFVSTGIALDAA